MRRFSCNSLLSHIHKSNLWIIRCKILKKFWRKYLLPDLRGLTIFDLDRPFFLFIFWSIQHGTKFGFKKKVRLESVFSSCFMLKTCPTKFYLFLIPYLSTLQLRPIRAEKVSAIYISNPTNCIITMD